MNEGGVELNQYVGKRVTLEGALGTGQPVTDAGGVVQWLVPVRIPPGREAAEAIART